MKLITVGHTVHSTLLNERNIPVIILGDFKVDLNENASNKNALN